jgi:hypothetical protein
MLSYSNDTEANQPFRNFVELVDTKCRELPYDIDHWIEMARKHDPSTRTHQNIIASSVKPRELYLETLQHLNVSLHQALALIDNTESLELPHLTMDMPIETLVRKFLEYSGNIREATEKNQSFSSFFNSILDRITFIRRDLNQTILRCAVGEINFKQAEHNIRVLEPVFEECSEKNILKKKSNLAELTELLLQKVEMDVSVRQSIQDRHVMHSTLQMYLNHVESNPDFTQLFPSLQYKIRQIISRPLDSILSKQQHEVDVAVYELQHLLEPVQGRMTVNVPDSAASVHQLIQQAIAQQEEMSRLKLNVMGAFKHLVTQLDEMFQFQPFTPVQSASVLGVAWMQHPLTSPESIRDFKHQLEYVKKSDAYQRLMQCFGNNKLDESFKFVDQKMSEMADQLEINERIKSINCEPHTNAIFNASDLFIKASVVDPMMARREIIHRAGYLMGIKKYIQQLCESVRAHLYLVYYEHSLQPEKINLTAKINAVLNQVSSEFYHRKQCDERIERHVFTGAVQQIFEEICDTELEKNMIIFNLRQRIKELFLMLNQTSHYSRKEIRKKIIDEKNELKEHLIDANIPRLRHFINTLSKQTYAGIHDQSTRQLESLKKKLRSLIQQKVAMEQVVIL